MFPYPLFLLTSTNSWDSSLNSPQDIHGKSQTLRAAGYFRNAPVMRNAIFASLEYP